MPHWLDGIAKILNSSSVDLKHLASIAGVDPTYIYRYSDLSKCDLRGQDLRGLDLTGANLQGALIDTRTKIDPDFDPRIKDRQYIRVRANRILIGIINSQASYHHYTYAIWYAKNMCERSSSLMKWDNHFISIIDYISSEPSMENFYDCRSKDSHYIKHVHIYGTNWENINKNLSGFQEEDRFSVSVLSMILFSETNRLLTSPELAMESILDRRDKFMVSARRQGMSLF